MRINGYINLQIEKGGGYDENLNPIPVEKTWSENIPCCWATNFSSNNGVYQDGKFTNVSYSIHIELQDLPYFDTIRLTDNRGNRLGSQQEEENRVFPILSIDYAENVNRINIVI